MSRPLTFYPSCTRCTAVHLQLFPLHVWTADVGVGAGNRQAESTEQTQCNTVDTTVLFIDDDDDDDGGNDGVSGNKSCR